MKALPARSDIACRLRQAREAAGLKQTDVARALGCSLKTVGNYECGRYAPTVEAFLVLLDLYGRSLSEWLDEAPPRNGSDGA